MIWTIIMAGGLGSRFWPISNTDCPKQFVDAMGIGKSMLQITFERYAKICRKENIVVVTGEAYADRVREQLPELSDYQVLSEPLRRNTAPCVAYAASVIAQMDPEATLIVTPSDHAVFRQEKFLTDLRQAIDTVQKHEWIVILGAQPVRPDTSYGYIQFKEPKAPSVDKLKVDKLISSNNSEATRQPILPGSFGATACDQRGANHSTNQPTNLFEVVTFTEKPPVEMARQFIASGEFFWNAGIFVWTLPVLRKAYEAFLPAIAESFFGLTAETPREELERIYSQCEAISVDNGIMEQASNVHVLAASFGWSDVETWESLYDVMRHDRNGNAILSGNVFTYDTKNTLVMMPNDPGKTVVLEGLDGYIVAANEDTLMVCRREKEERIFRFSNDVEMKRLIDKKGSKKQ